MKLKYVYLVLTILGLGLPLYHFIPFLTEHGLNFSLFYDQLVATPISRFFGWDVIVSAVVVIAFVLKETPRMGMKLCLLPIFATLTVGVSFGLPLFLTIREFRLEKMKGK